MAAGDSVTGAEEVEGEGGWSESVDATRCCETRRTRDAAGLEERMEGVGDEEKGMMIFVGNRNQVPWGVRRQDAGKPRVCRAASLAPGPISASAGIEPLPTPTTEQTGESYSSGHHGSPTSVI